MVLNPVTQKQHRNLFSESRERKKTIVELLPPKTLPQHGRGVAFRVYKRAFFEAGTQTLWLKGKTPSEIN